MCEDRNSPLRCLFSTPSSPLSPPLPFHSLQQYKNSKILMGMNPILHPSSPPSPLFTRLANGRHGVCRLLFEFWRSHSLHEPHSCRSSRNTRFFKRSLEFAILCGVIAAASIGGGGSGTKESRSSSNRSPGRSRGFGSVAAAAAIESPTAL